MLLVLPILTGVAHKPLAGDLNGGTYRLRDLTKGNGVITLHGKTGWRGNDFTSTSSNWNLTGFDQAAMDAHFGVFINLSFLFESIS